jgi:hypothetical protein
MSLQGFGGGGGGGSDPDDSDGFNSEDDNEDDDDDDHESSPKDDEEVKKKNLQIKQKKEQWKIWKCANRAIELSLEILTSAIICLRKHHLNHANQARTHAQWYKDSLKGKIQLPVSNESLLFIFPLSHMSHNHYCHLQQHQMYTPADFRTTAAAFRSIRDKLREDIQALQKDRDKLKLELKESLSKKPSSVPPASSSSDSKPKRASVPPASSSSDSKPKRATVVDQYETADILKQFQPFKGKLLSDHYFYDQLDASLSVLHSESGNSEALSISIADVLAKQDTKQVTKNVKVLIKYAELSKRDPESLTNEEKRQCVDANEFFRLLSTQASQTPEGRRHRTDPKSAANILPPNQQRTRDQTQPYNIAGKCCAFN